jgi:23S rRNA A1618 N6-methylase RlmF
MITQLNKSLLFSTFDVQSFDMLESAMNSMAPSMVEYYLSDLSSNNTESYLNKREIQTYINIGEYNLYIDYGENIYLEIQMNQETYETASLW